MDWDDCDTETVLWGLIGMALCGAAVDGVRTRLKTRKRRRFKTRPINLERKSHGQFQYFLKMKECDSDQFFKYTRMDVPTFDILLGKISHLIKKREVIDGISAEERLAITLQYLSQGMSMQTLAWAFQIGHTTVHKVVNETCVVLWNILSDEYLKSPTTEAEWKDIAHGFFEKWNYPNCLGALDGKHIHIQCPTNSGSQFFNYKKTFSIVLMAACDADYKFTVVDIGAYGGQSDGGVFRASNFGLNFEDDTMGVPPPQNIPNTDVNLPFCLVADEAFPLKNYIMRPYPGRNLSLEKRIFNYRLSRARRCIENTFGILVARWRILKTIIGCKVENIDHIVKACVVLHNFCLIQSSKNQVGGPYCPPGYVDTDDEDNGGWRNDLAGGPLPSVGRLSANNARRLLYQVRDTFARYFMSAVGQLPWQLDRVQRGMNPDALGRLV